MKNLCLILLIALAITNAAQAQKAISANQVGNFSNGLAPFMIDNKWGFFDKSGIIAIQPKHKAFVTNYGDLPAFSEGLTTVVDPTTDRIGYINTKGEMAIAPAFYSAAPFSEGVAFVGRQNDHVLIDTAGKIIAQNFVAINGYYSRFSNNRACVQKEFSYGYIDKTGRFVISPKFEEAKDFSCGLAAVKKDSKWGFVDTSGAVVVDFKFSNEPMPFKNGRAFVQGTNNKWGIIDTSGALIVEPIYSQVFNFDGGVAAVSVMDEKWNSTFLIIDTNGELVKKFAKAKNSNETITILSGFSEGLAIAMKGYKKGFIDSKGNTVVGFIYRELKPMSCGMAYFEKFNEKTKTTSRGFVDSKGKERILIEEPKF